jgi:hypothetical protein
MKSIPCYLLAVTLVLAPTAYAQEGAAIWKSLQEPQLDPGKDSRIKDLVLTRDRVQLTFTDGRIRATAPLNGVVWGAAFSGKGRVQVQPPSALEAQQLRLYTGQDALDLPFTDAVLLFSDDTFAEISRAAEWEAVSDLRLSRMFADRHQEREEVGGGMSPRVFEGILSPDRARHHLFAADLKTDSKGWIHVRFDATDPEEITVAQWKNWGGVMAADTWLSFPAGGRSPQEVLRDPASRHDFTIRHYVIDAAVTPAAELSATARVGIEYRVPQVRVLTFALDSRLRVEAVTVSGKALEFFQPRDPKDRTQSYGDYVSVLLDAPPQAGQQQVLEFRYRGKRVIRRVGDGNYFCESFGWYPARPNSFASRADFELNFQFPGKYKLVATGTRVREGADGDVASSTWKSDIPLAVAGFAYGDFKVETLKSGSIDVEVFANRRPDDTMMAIQRLSEGGGPGSAGRPAVALGSLNPSAITKLMAQEVSNSLQLFQAYFGPFPYKRLAVTNIPYSYGQGWPMLLYLSALSFLDSTQRNALGIQDQVGITDFFRAHETSHQWWGHGVGWKSYHDQWLSEGFAQFSGNLYVQARRNQKEYLTRLRMDKEELKVKDERGRPFESLGPIWMGSRLASSDAPRGYSTVIYNKGGYVLHMLRMLFYDRTAKSPDGRFIAMMQDFCGSFRNQPASTEDFKAIVEKHMLSAMDLDGNKRMDWFFNQYVYGTGIPEYRFSYHVSDAGNGAWKVDAKVNQVKVPEGWRMLIPLYVHASGNAMKLGVVRAIGPETSISFGLGFKPEKISLNENEDMLAEIKQ